LRRCWGRATYNGNGREKEAQMIGIRPATRASGG
jgi:hypothetical protein